MVLKGKQIPAFWTYALVIMTVITVSLFVNSAYAQVGGIHVPINQSELALSVVGNSLIWILPAAAIGAIIFKIKFKKK